MEIQRPIRHRLAPTIEPLLVFRTETPRERRCRRVPRRAHRRRPSSKHRVRTALHSSPAGTQSTGRSVPRRIIARSRSPKVDSRRIVARRRGAWVVIRRIRISKAPRDAADRVSVQRRCRVGRRPEWRNASRVGLRRCDPPETAFDIEGIHDAYPEIAVGVQFGAGSCVSTDRLALSRRKHSRSWPWMFGVVRLQLLERRVTRSIEEVLDELRVMMSNLETEAVLA
jgi:hypothetical protein